MPLLSKRLKYVADEIGKVNTLADVGTDHGKLIVYALKHDLVERAFAIDISQKSLNKAKLLADESGVGDKVRFLHGDGLLALQETPDMIVIAGMGGNEIVKILSDRTLKSRYVLLPHQDASVLRRYLCAHEFNIVKDYVIFDGKFYNILVVEKGCCRYSEGEIVLGKNNPATKEFEERLVARKAQIEMIMSQQSVGVDKLQEEIREEYEEIEKWLRLQTL